MKLLASKKVVAAEGSDIVKSFTVPASVRKSGGLGLGQGLLINEIFTAAGNEISRLALNHDYAVTPESRQVLFFAHTLPGDLVHVHVKAVRRTRNIKITVELRKDAAEVHDPIATGKFVYGIR
ncbi:hypothetical protein ACTHGU_03875 [Chitinophagaceae bacterium MMS25-I14]